MPTGLQFSAARGGLAHPGRQLFGNLRWKLIWMSLAMYACTSRPSTTSVKATPEPTALQQQAGGAEAPDDQPPSGQAPRGQNTSWVYRAPSACPNEARFLEQVAARSPVLQRESAPDATAAPTREVQVAISGGPPKEWTGRVVIESAGDEVAREVSGASCDEVVVALALITSFWIRPRPPASPPDDTLTDLRPAPSGATDSGGAYGAHLIGHVGFASSPAGGARAGARFELWGGPSVASWAAAAALSYQLGQHTNDRLGTSSLVLLLGQLDLCPPGIGVEGPVWLRPCAHVRGGGLRFQAPVASLDDARAQWRPWAAAGVGLHLGIPVSSVLTLRVLGELSANLVRDDFGTERGVGDETLPAVEIAPLYTPGLASLDLGVGVSYDF